MPIYDYECEGCGPFTAMQTMARYRDPRPCPECGAASLQILVSAPGIAGDNWVPGGPSAAERDIGNPRPTSTAHPAGCGCCMRRWPLPGGRAAGGGRIFTSYGPVGRSSY